MIKVVLFGAGNLAFHLTNKLLNSSGIDLVQVYNRSIENIDYLKSKTSITNSLETIKEADIYILCVSDNAIAEVSSQLKIADKLVVHTSGALAINELKTNTNKGVLYFLQSFSKNVEIDFSKIPIALEAENEKDFQILETLARFFSEKIYPINSEQRKTLHVAAVFVNNFTNHLYYKASKICEENQIPFEILLPLIDETSEKIKNIHPFEAQTGPAKRNDTKTINKHLAMLNNSNKDIYTLLTNSILKTYE